VLVSSTDKHSIAELPSTGFSPVDIRRAAMDLLARREHSFEELVNKLFTKFSRKLTASLPESGGSLFNSRPTSSPEKSTDVSILNEVIKALIDQQVTLLANENLQSDERFVEAFINGRKSQGKGPVRIRNELEQKHLDSHLIETYLDECDEEWFELAKQVYAKKFGRKAAADYQEKAKRFRFMQYRGFPYQLLQSIII